MAGMRLDRMSRFGALGIPASNLILNLRRKKQESKVARVPPGMEVPRSRRALVAANGAASAAGASSEGAVCGERGETGAGWTAGRVVGGGPAVGRALGSFDFAQPQSLLFTRKGGRLPYPVPVDRRANDLYDRGGGGGRGGGGKARS
jgi:hypothetical protein